MRSKNGLGRSSLSDKSYCTRSCGNIVAAIFDNTDPMFSPDICGRRCSFPSTWNEEENLNGSDEELRRVLHSFGERWPRRGKQNFGLIACTVGLGVCWAQAMAPSLNSRFWARMGHNLKFPCHASFSASLSKSNIFTKESNTIFGELTNKLARSGGAIS